MSSRAALPIAFVALGIAVGVALGLLREATVPTAALLYVEPLPAVIGVWAVHICFVSDRWAAGVGAAVGTVCLLLLARLLVPAEIPWALSGQTQGVAAAAPCAGHVNSPESFILGLWSDANDAGTVSTLADVADVLILTRPHVDVEAALADVGGELIRARTGTWVWARGGFSLCGEDEVWPVGHSSALLFAAPGADTSVPLIVTDLATFGPGLESEIGDLGAVAEALGGDNVVIAGAGSFPTSFQRTDHRLRAAGLLPLRLPPNAPATWGHVPLVSLRAVNHVWTARGWSGRAQRWTAGKAFSDPVLVRLDYQTP